MSRDPSAGNIKIPATLHKYVYANGDPINGRDPTGRGDLSEVSLEDWQEISLNIKKERISECAELLLEEMLFNYPQTPEWGAAKAVEDCVEMLYPGG